MTLEQVQTPLVIYLQEDYFIERPADVDRINSLAKLMIDDPSIGHIGLTRFGSGGPLIESKYRGLLSIAQRAPYRVSMQAGLWRLDTLKSYLLPWESGWMFELFGTLRSWRRDDVFLTVDRRDEFPPITYQHTGIIKGKWSEFVPALFERESLSIDFSRRGFYDATTPAWRRRAALLRSISKQPIHCLRSLTSK